MATEPAAKVKGRGRPVVPEQELITKIYDASLNLLLSQGYAATTMDAVAKEAGVSKKTLYRFVENREDLIEQIVRGWTDTFVPLFTQDTKNKTEFYQLLAEHLTAMSHKVLSAEAVGLFCLLSSEFPGRETLLARYQTSGIERGRALLTEWLSRHRAFLPQPHPDPALVSDLLLSMVMAEPLRQIALKLASPAPYYPVEARITAAIALLKQ
ncbi:TetR/AcrR family transcriptional regulator [Morganella psychrotolerans]|uniref:TetR/AcrR family transcriptional regulator n=1 Tax=Morganella psychrotolerans TaxID=368603 RepID=UPI0039B036FD